MLTGLRGVGKTVLLNQIEKMAKEMGYRSIAMEAYEEKPLGAFLIPHLRTLLYDLDRVEGVKEKIKRAFSVLRSFIGAVKLKVDDVSIGLDVEPEKGTADSGDIQTDLPNLFVAIGEAAEDKRQSVALFIDEIQFFSASELGSLIMAMHKIQQKALPIVLLGAGLPILPGLAGESKSYAERLFNFPDIGPLSPSDADKALRDPARAAGVIFEPEALNEVYRLTKGYPYFIQEWGYHAWNMAENSPITLSVVNEATNSAKPRLDENFFRVRFDRLTPSEKKFLRAMASLGPGNQRTGDIAQKLGVKVTGLTPTRAKLIKKGMIYSPAHGEMAFTVPLFDEFMRRAMPE